MLSPSVATIDGVGLLHPCLAQHLGVHAVAHDEAARPVLAEALERLLLLVDRADVPALGLQRFRARRADPTAADDDGLHRRRLAILGEHVLREGDDEHLARCVAQDVLDGG